MTGPVKWPCALVLAMLAVAWPAGSRAQDASSRPPAEAPGEYQRVLVEALSEFDRGNWSEAEVLLRKAHRLWPNARTLRALGVVSYELRRYVDACDYLDQALIHADRPLTAEMRNEAESIRARAFAFLGRLRIEVTPPSAEVEIDGQPARERPDGSVWLDPGEHHLTLRAPGHLSQQRRISLRGDTLQTLEVRLPIEGGQPRPDRAGAPAPVAPARDPVEPVAASDGGPGALPWVLGGVGLAALVAGGITGVMALRSHADAEDGCPKRIDCGPEALDARDDAEVEANVSNVTLAAGAVLVGVAAALWLGAPAPAETPAARALVGPGLAWIGVGGEL